MADRNTRIAPGIGDVSSSSRAKYAGLAEKGELRKIKIGGVKFANLLNVFGQQDPQSGCPRLTTGKVSRHPKDLPGCERNHRRFNMVLKRSFEEAGAVRVVARQSAKRKGDF